MSVKVYLRKGDITTMEVDAIVNSANTELILGGGVAGAIRRNGGPAIQEECNKIGIIPLGEAAITSAGNLKAKYIIHAASVSLGRWATTESVRNAIKNSFKRAQEKKIKTIAFPAIGSGIGGLQIDKCAEILLSEVLRHINSPTSLEIIYFVLYDDKSYKAFEEKFDEVKAKFEHPTSEARSDASP